MKDDIQGSGVKEEGSEEGGERESSIFFKKNCTFFIIVYLLHEMFKIGE